MNMTGNAFPLQVQILDPEETGKRTHCMTGETMPHIGVGPQRYYFPLEYLKIAADIYNMPLRNTDVFIVSFPRSGTTWTQELVWLIANNLNFTVANITPLTKRYAFLELSMLFTQQAIEKLIMERKQNVLDELKDAEIESLNKAPTPRFLKTHIPLSMLPPTLLDTGKVVYIARDPRDVAVSMYHHSKMVKNHGSDGSFKSFWDFFIRGLQHSTPYFSHIKEAWQRRTKPNMLFLFYEELSQDLPTVAHRVANFFGKKLTTEETATLCQHLTFDNFKNNNAVNKDFVANLDVRNETSKFVRRGKAGGWRDYFDAEMTLQAERWIAENLRDTDLRFPEINNSLA